MTRLLWVTRSLLALSALGAVLALAIAAIGLAPIVMPVAPLAVSRLPELRPAGQALLAAAPERNPFDPQGKPWDTVLASGAAPVVAEVRLIGISTLRGLRGVFTSQGFIAIGRPFQDGILARVSPDVVVVRTPQGERRIALDASRRGFATQLRALTKREKGDS